MNNSGGGLLDHLDALRGTLLWCLGAMVLLSIPGVVFAPDLLLLYVKRVCPPGLELHYFTPFEPFIVELELGLLFGFFCALPFILVKLGEFISPGLYRHERCWFFFFIVSSLLFMAAGAALALGGVVPIVMRFSGTFASEGLKPVIGLAAFLRMAGLLAAGFAFVFELPAALLPAIRFGLVKVETLRRRRPLLVVLLFAGAAFLTPPDIVSQLLLALPGWVLFEITLFVGGRIAPAEEKAEEVDAEKRAAASPRRDEEEAGRETALPVDDSPYRRAMRKKRRIRPL